MTEPRRRRTDGLNGKLRLVGFIAPWLFVGAGWAYSLGVNNTHVEDNTHAIQALEMRIERAEERERVVIRELGELTQAVGTLNQSVLELHRELREHRRETQ